MRSAVTLSAIANVSGGDVECRLPGASLWKHDQRVVDSTRQGRVMPNDTSKLAMEPVRQSVRVPAEPARAFRVFTAALREWWEPAISANPTKSPIAEIVLESKAGGRWFERGVDGSECDWARVLTWEPGERFVVEWKPDGRATRLEVTFENPAPRATNVTLIHSGFEAYGDRAVRTREQHDAVWANLLARYTRFMEEQPVDDAVAGAHDRAARAVTDGETILATIDVSASPDRVFRALTTNETEKWWGAPDTYRVTKWQSALHGGGAWSLVVVTPDGGAFPAGGSYVDIDAPRRVVMTRHYDFDYPELGRSDTTVTYRIDPVSAGSRVTVRHDGFAGLRVAADHHAEGWVGFLGYLAAYLNAETRADA